VNFPAVKSSVSAFLDGNAGTILTAGGVVGTVTTAVLSAKAHAKATVVLIQAEAQYALEHDDVGRMDTKDKALLVWPHYVPPVIIGSLTVGSIVAANMVSAKKAAALTAAYAVADGRLTEYKDKVAEKLTGPKKQAIHDEIAQDRVTKNPPTDKEVIIIASGEVLCHDSLTGRYFHSTVEQIRKAEHIINNELATCQYASLSQFFDEIGLTETAFSDTVGWSALNQDTPFELQLSAVVTPEQKPCISIDYSILPTPDYTRSY
jgi:hypothetical protein